MGKNPWISHGIPHARTTLKAIAADPDRAIVVIDPRVTETAAMADFHLQVRPGRDAWLVAAMAAVLVDEGLLDRQWLADHASGLDHVDAGTRHQTGVAPNELTASEDRDPWAGTPWHKSVPARLERVPA